MAKIFKWNPNQTATGKGVSVATVEDTATGVVEGVGMGCDRIATKTATGRDGLLYSALTKEPAMTLKDGVLVASLEGESTNFCSWSNDFGQWSKIGNSPTITGGQYNSLTGKNDATLYSNPLNNGGIRTSAVNSEGVGSVFVKGDQGKSFKMDLASGDSVIHTFNGEWERVSVLSTIPYTTVSINNYTGSTGVDFLMYQCDVTELNYLTSPIFTNGSTQTRDADVGFKTPDISSLINLNSGVLEVEMAALVNGGANRKLSISDGTNDNRVEFGYNSSSNNLTLTISIGGVLLANTAFDAGFDQTIKALYELDFTTNNPTLKRDGVNVWTDNITINATEMKYIKMSNAIDLDNTEANVNYLKFTSND